MLGHVELKGEGRGVEGEGEGEGGSFRRYLLRDLFFHCGRSSIVSRFVLEMQSPLRTLRTSQGDTYYCYFSWSLLPSVPSLAMLAPSCGWWGGLRRFCARVLLLLDRDCRHPILSSSYRPLRKTKWGLSWSRRLPALTWLSDLAAGSAVLQSYRIRRAF